jgi:uncharacterized protein YjbI with pentapeptide repeats
VSDDDESCDYKLTREDYADLVGSDRTWEEFLTKKAANGDELWECPHDTPEGKDECVFHLDPLEVPDGVDEGTALRAAIRQSDETEGEGSYRYKQFIGATFGDLHLGGKKIRADDGEPLDFTGATFKRNVGVSATIEQPVVLDHAVFEQGTQTDFAGSTFENLVTARDAVFAGLFLCNNVLFARGANFEKATFTNTVNFDRSVFGNTASFHETRFGPRALFREVTFRARAIFTQSIVDGGIDFERSTFRDVADFKQCALGGRMWFTRVTFEDIAQFRETLFSGEADFEGAVFEGTAEFGKNLMFSPAEFRGPTSFTRANLSGATFREVNLVGAVFDGADLTETTMTGCDLRFASVETAIFSRATLFDADLRGCALAGAVVTDARINDATQLLHPPTNKPRLLAFVPKRVTGLARRFGLLSEETPTIPTCGYDWAFRPSGIKTSQSTHTEATSQPSHGSKDERDSPNSNSSEDHEREAKEDTEASTRNHGNDRDEYDGQEPEATGESDTVSALTTLITGLEADSLPTGPDPEVTPPDDDPDSAKSVYRAIENLASLNSRPRLQGRSFIRRQDVQARQYRATAANSSSTLSSVTAGARLIRAAIARASLLYGESPWRVIGVGLSIIVAFGLLYPLGGWLRTTTEGGSKVTYARILEDPVLLWRSVYHSAMMFATGNQYGGLMAADEIGQVITSGEALLGPTLLALLVFVLGRRAAR